MNPFIMFKTNFKNSAFALLRISASAMLLTNGVPKLERLISGNTDFPDPLGIGSLPSLLLTIFGEVIAPLFVILGYKTRPFALPPAITMLVAALVVHHSDPFNRKELALMFAVCFIFIFLVGPGKYSIDKS